MTEPYKPSHYINYALTAGVFEQAALRRHDESILVHFQGRDCVAIEACYHKACYLLNTKCITQTKNCWSNIVRQSI